MRHLIIGITAAMGLLALSACGSQPHHGHQGHHQGHHAHHGHHADGHANAAHGVKTYDSKQGCGKRMVYPDLHGKKHSPHHFGKKPGCQKGKDGKCGNCAHACKCAGKKGEHHSRQWGHGIGSHADAAVKNRHGKLLGNAHFQQGPNGVLAEIDLRGLPTGWHAIHVHGVGLCNAADFESAGAHAAGHAHHGHAVNHGFLSHGKSHAGDMPNIWVHRDGTAKVNYFLKHAYLHDLLDHDGASVIVHEKGDDYISQPSGAAGGRIACGVLQSRR